MSSFSLEGQMKRSEVIKEIVKLCGWDRARSPEALLDESVAINTHRIFVFVEEPSSVDEITSLLFPEIPTWMVSSFETNKVYLIEGTTVIVHVASNSSMRGAQPTILWIDGSFKKDITDCLNGLPRQDKYGKFNIFRT